MVSFQRPFLTGKSQVHQTYRNENNTAESDKHHAAYGHAQTSRSGFGVKLRNLQPNGTQSVGGPLECLSSAHEGMLGSINLLGPLNAMKENFRTPRRVRSRIQNDDPVPSNSA